MRHDSRVQTLLLDELELLGLDVDVTPKVSVSLNGSTAAIGVDLLDDVEHYAGRFVAFPSEHARVATVLWVAHSHGVNAFESSPRLALLSPEPGSGKTRVLEVVETMAPGAMHVLSASTPAVFRTIEAETTTLLLDEVDTIFGRRGRDENNEDMRALLNAGHRRGATIPRCVGPTHEVRRFPVYAAVALAGLGDLPETLMTRSVIIRMRRRTHNEVVEPFRHRRDAPVGAELRNRLHDWVGSVLEDLRDAWPEMPDGITDRPADCWEPLLAIADAAGGRWPSRARLACTALAGAAVSREASLGIRLLSDLRDVFDGTDRLPTSAILDGLHKLEESPWSNLKGSALDARGLAWRLGNYEVSSTKVKVDGKALQGYRREDLWDCWERYCPLPTSQAAEPPEPAELPRSEHPSEVPASEQVPEPGQRTEPAAPPLTSDVPQVPEVPPLSEGDPDYDEALIGGAS